METTVDVKQKAKWPCIEDVVKHKLWLAYSVLWLGLITFIYWPTFTWWWGEWWKDESYYSHGILIPVMSGFVIWFNWNRIKKCRVEPSLWGLAILAPMVLLHYKAQANNVPSIPGMTLPIVLAAIAYIIFGKSSMREFGFPLAFLYFMVVPPTTILERVSFEIQLMSTKVATMGLHVLGLDAVQVGTQINLPNGLQMVVGAPCSGFRMLIALLAFTIFFAFMKNGPNWGKIALVVFVIPLSLIANSVRVLLIALVGEYYGGDAMHSFHDYSGYIVLAITFGILVLLAKVVKCKDFKSMPS